MGESLVINMCTKHVYVDCEVCCGKPGCRGLGPVHFPLLAYAFHPAPLLQDDQVSRSPSLQLHMVSEL